MDFIKTLLKTQLFVGYFLAVGYGLGSICAYLVKSNHPYLIVAFLFISFTFIIAIMKSKIEQNIDNY